jgi:hypothetical protein
LIQDQKLIPVNVGDHDSVYWREAPYSPCCKSAVSPSSRRHDGLDIWYPKRASPKGNRHLEGIPQKNTCRLYLFLLDFSRKRRFISLIHSTYMFFL